MRTQNNQSPPRSVERFLGWICKGELLEEILGDLEEYHHELMEKPTWKRKLFYWFEVLNFLRPFALRAIVEGPRLYQLRLFKNYYKTSSRNLKRNPLTSFINIFGLAIAIGFCIVAYTFFDYDSRLDQYHEHKNEVYLVTHSVDREGETKRYGTSPAPLGKLMGQDISQIEKVCRLQDGHVVMKFKHNVFHEKVRFVDGTFLEMFTFPLRWGVSSDLNDPNSIILSDEMAIKYFGHENPVGKEMTMIFSGNDTKSFKIAGVADPFPRERTIAFDFLVNFKNYELFDPTYDKQDWKQMLNATLVQISNPLDIQTVVTSTDKYKDIQNSVNKDWAINSFEFETLANLHLASAQILDDISYDEGTEARQGLPIIALFMLLLACFNYINIAIVTAAKRLKEIGLRKVIGANRGLVITQFLAENIFVTFFALLVGIALAILIIIPWFEEMSGWYLKMSYDDLEFWGFLFLIMFTTGIASGIYPAFYISRFEVVRIFKGTVQFGKKNTLTKIFLGVQLVLTCMAITIAVMFFQNNSYQNERSWGYNQKDALYVHVQDQSAYDKLSAVMAQNANVLSIAGSSNHLGRNNDMAVLRTADYELEAREMNIGETYLETMGIDLVEGRLFEKDRESDMKGIVVNELLVEYYDLYDPIGMRFKIDSIDHTIIGVVKDFHIYNFYDKMRPTIFKLTDTEDYQFLTMKVRPGTQSVVYENLKSEWAILFPEIPFNGGHQEDLMKGFFSDVDTAEYFYRVLAFIAILLATLGLYGLVSLNVAGRAKEFSIRKILGAGVKNITKNIGKEYAVLFVLSLFVGIPFSYYMAVESLNMLYAYPMPITYSGVIISLILLLFVMFAVIFTQINKVSKSNPVDGLRVE